MGGRCFPPVGDAGVSDAGSDASVGTDSGAPRDGGLDASDGSLDVTPPGEDDGCGCRAGSPATHNGRYAMLGVAGAFAALSRRRRRR